MFYQLGDHVLARVVNQDTGLECYVPGIVTMTPKRMADQAQFFTIGMYNGQVVSNELIPRTQLHVHYGIHQS